MNFNLPLKTIGIVFGIFILSKIAFYAYIFLGGFK